MAPLPIATRALLLAGGSELEEGIRSLTQFSTASVIIALLALTVIVTVGFVVFLFGFVRLLARR